MLRLLEEVSGELAARGIAHGLIGAGALAVHGVSRSTFDLDLLVTDRKILARAFWDPLTGRGAVADVRVGDDEDPLAGVIRVSSPGERPVDVVVGRHAWQAEILTRTTSVLVGGVPVPAVGRADLLLLKLFAGGPQDAWDIDQLLQVGDRDLLVAEVEARLGPLPAEAAARWRRILGG